MNGEPPAKNTDNPDKPTISEEEGKGKELSAASEESNKFLAAQKAAAEAAAARAAGEEWAKK